MKISIPQNMDKFLTTSGTMSFLKRALLHGEGCLVGWYVCHCLLCCFFPAQFCIKVAPHITSPFECHHSGATAGWEAAWHGTRSCSPSPPSHVLLLPGTGIQSYRYSKACQQSDTGEVSKPIMLHNLREGIQGVTAINSTQERFMNMKVVQ
jgi:hypothetical protein